MGTEKNPIQDAMNQPKKGTVDGQSFEQHSLPDMIAADRYLRAQSASKRRGSGLKFNKFRAGGAV